MATVIDITELGKNTPVISLSKAGAEGSSNNSSDAISIDGISNGSLPKPSVNFGGGIELLMNDKQKKPSSKGASDIGLDDINSLEAELNELSGAAPGKSVNICLLYTSPSPRD